MRTKLYGKSNATLTEVGGETICIIVCGKDEEISKKIKTAIKEHHIVDNDSEVTIDVDHQTEEAILTNQEPITFSAEWIEDGESIIRDFELRIVATYK